MVDVQAEALRRHAADAEQLRADDQPHKPGNDVVGHQVALEKGDIAAQHGAHNKQQAQPGKIEDHVLQIDVKVPGDIHASCSRWVSP